MGVTACLWASKNVMSYIGSVVHSQFLLSCGAGPVDSRVALKQPVWLREESFLAWVHEHSACNDREVVTPYSFANKAPIPQKEMITEIVHGNRVMATLQSGRIS